MAVFIMIVFTLLIGALLEHFGFFRRLDIVSGEAKNDLAASIRHGPVRISLRRRVRPSTGQKLAEFGLAPVEPEGSIESLPASDAEIGEEILNQEVGREFLESISQRDAHVTAEIFELRDDKPGDFRSSLAERAVLTAEDVVLHAGQMVSGRETLVLAISEKMARGIKIKLREGSAPGSKAVFAGKRRIVEVAEAGDLKAEDISVVYVPAEDIAPHSRD